MKKKTILFLAILALVTLPAAAMAAAEFSLGGYVKLESDWDSTQMNKNMTWPVLRNNDPNFQHGRLKFTANSTRFNLTIKGPKLWGAEVTGLIECDFDAQGNANPGVAAGQDTGVTSNNFRMRHAMFRLNWPETELLLGQYWGYFSEFTPETANDSGCQFVGSPTQRLPQVRLTQKFLGAYTVSMLIGAPFNTGQDTNFTFLSPAPANLAPGESSETPQIQGKVGFEQDLWGKAGFYGRPRGFVAQVAAGWQKSRFRQGFITGARTWAGDWNGWLGIPRGEQFVLNPNAYQRDQQYLDHWIVMGSLFVPIIPTYSPNLAGTLSLSTQWYIGQGVNAFGEAQDFNSTYFNWQGFGFLPGGVGFVDFYDRALMKQYGGFIQMQYYFSNQWFINAVWGMSKVYGIPTETAWGSWNPVTNPGAYRYLATADQFKFWQEYNLTLWYRPITALKFGLQYSYSRTDWLRNGSSNVGTVFWPNPQQGQITNVGQNHRLMFAGFFYF